ncbi:hypothetical protein [Halobacterium litoreum]|uniref:Tat (Twin-arginine translocation) pathway signal sequence n=1 Tax=Halobacterium litoreum TaxID=2039234 RepID=A0ABD5NG63_9EURY|nr:hypothetical protein [Halobacterium litoreum]UHH12964.1 hypothetical protein LT972_12470 [Halobacterium litoreum]
MSGERSTSEHVESDDSTTVPRRTFLQGIGGTAVAGATIAGFSNNAAATDSTGQPNVDIKSVRKVGETDHPTKASTVLQYVVKVVKYDGNGKVEATDYFKTRVVRPTDATATSDAAISGPGVSDGTDDELAVAQIDESEFKSLTRRQPEPTVTATGVQPMDNEGVIERQKMVSAETGSCSVHGNYTHKFKGGAIEFTQRVNDIGITTVAAAIATYVSSAGLAVAVTLLGGAIALVSDTDSITAGVNEVDTIFGTVPNYIPVAAVGYDVTDESHFVSPTDTAPPGHPFR